MTKKELQDRTRRFAVRSVRFCGRVATTWDGRRIAGQLLDSSTSVSANYRSACRGRSRAELIAKIGVAAEEADESVWWLELIDALETHRGAESTWLLAEANELLAILSASQKTAKENRQRGVTVTVDSK